MKNFTLIFICFIALTLTVSAQQKYFHIGSGLGVDPRDDTFFEKRVASLYLGGESNKRIWKAIDENIDFVSLGWYFNAGLWKYDFIDFDGDTDTELTSARASIGARINLRLLHLVDYFIKDTEISVDGLDVYTGVNLGPEFSYYIDFDDPFETHFFIAPFFGARYLLTDKFGVFAEVGNTNYSLFNLGITFGSNKSVKE